MESWFLVKISVIIPVFNVENYLAKCLDSVINQTLKEIEIICVDDGSTDNSFNILNEYKNSDDRIQVYQQENGGHSAATNTALKYIKGDYIFFLDSDDWIELDALEKLYNNATENNSDLVLYDSIEHLPQNQFRERRFYILNDLKNQIFDYKAEKRLILNSYYVQWAKLYKTSFFKQYNLKLPDFLLYEDIGLNVASTVFAKRITYLDEILYHYNKLNESSLQNTKIEMDRPKIIFDVINYVEKFLKENNLFSELELNFLEFKIKQPKIIFDNLSNDLKEKFYQFLRKCYLSIDSSPKILSKLPFEFYSFFIHVITLKNYEQYSSFDFYKHNVNELFFDYIDKNDLNLKLNNFNDNLLDKNSDIIISIASFPERINEVQYSIYSLLNQSLSPKEVVLWLAIEEFPNKEQDLPDALLNLQNNGLSIKWCNNLKSFKKLIPSLKEYSSSIIVTADDDIFYRKNWLKSLHDAYLKNPNSIICGRGRKIKVKGKTLDKYETWEVCKTFENPSYLNLMTGIGGVLYPPNSLNNEVFDYDLACKLCPDADDLWFWAMAVLNKTKITIIDFEKLISINISRDLKFTTKKRLFDSNIDKNDVQVENILNNFPEILEIIGDEFDRK